MSIIKKLIIAITFSISLSANNLEYSKLSENIVDTSEFESLSHIEDKHNKLFRSLKESAIANGPNYVAEQMKRYYPDGLGSDMSSSFLNGVKEIRSPALQTTFFMLTSESVPLSSVRNFIYGVEKLKTLGFSVQGFVVFQNFVGNSIPEMKHYMNDLNITGSPSTKVKIHPDIFKNSLVLKKAPAFVVAKCPFKKFQEKYCKYEYVVRGMVPFENFLSILESEGVYKNMYYEFIKPE